MLLSFPEQVPAPCLLPHHPRIMELLVRLSVMEVPK
jgi:hypothetical protein